MCRTSSSPKLMQLNSTDRDGRRLRCLFTAAPDTDDFPDDPYILRKEGMLCAQHALNALLQGQYFTAVDLAEIARRLDAEERKVTGDSTSESQNMDDSGYFSLQVISEALKPFNLTLRVAPTNASDVINFYRSHSAFICHRHQHFFTVRKIGEHWYNLNSMLDGPELISQTYSELYLAQLQKEGCTILAVEGDLPVNRVDSYVNSPVSYSARSSAGYSSASSKSEQKSRPLNSSGNAEFSAQPTTAFTNPSPGSAVYQEDDPALQTALLESIRDLRDQLPSISDEFVAQQSSTSPTVEQNPAMPGTVAQVEDLRLRRAQFLDHPTEFLQIHGEACKIYADAAAANAATATWRRWQGNPSVMIDRFDVRAHLDTLPSKEGATGKRKSSTTTQKMDSYLNYERFRILVINDFLKVPEEHFLKQMYLEEHFGSSVITSVVKREEAKKKQLAPERAAIGYSYEDSTELCTDTAKTKPWNESINKQPSVSQLLSSDEEDLDELKGEEFDVHLDINQLTKEDILELDRLGARYHIKPGDFAKFLRQDEIERQEVHSSDILREEQDPLRQIIEAGKETFERTATKNTMLRKEEPSVQLADSDYSNSSSSSHSSSNGEVTFITSFGGESPQKMPAKAKAKLKSPFDVAGPYKERFHGGRSKSKKKIFHSTSSEDSSSNYRRRRDYRRRRCASSSDVESKSHSKRRRRHKISSNSRHTRRNRHRRKSYSCSTSSDRSNTRRSRSRTTSSSANGDGSNNDTKKSCGSGDDASHHSASAKSGNSRSSSVQTTGSRISSNNVQLYSEERAHGSQQSDASILSIHSSMSDSEKERREVENTKRRLRRTKREFMNAKNVANVVTNDDHSKVSAFCVFFYLNAKFEYGFFNKKTTKPTGAELLKMRTQRALRKMLARNQQEEKMKREERRRERMIGCIMAGNVIVRGRKSAAEITDAVFDIAIQLHPAGAVDDANATGGREINMPRSDGRWICWVEGCCQLFGNQILLKKHLHNVHNIGTYVTEYICPESGCLKVFESKKLCRDHVHSAHGDYRCNVCEKRFQSRGSWKKHEKIHEGYKCSHEGCKRTFQKHNELRKHVAQMHPLPLDCTECGKTFSQRQCLRRHLRSHVNFIPCPVSGCTHKASKSGIARHVKENHADKLVDQRKEESLLREKLHFVCPNCGKHFAIARYLTRHVQRMHEGKKGKPRRLYECFVKGCGLKFRSLVQLKDHNNTHTGLKPYVCEESGCGHTFACRSSLQQHMKKIHVKSLSVVETVKFFSGLHSMGRMSENG
ncbi:Ataxin-3 [Trichinella nativa]|uniref:Ataxin-3 homolog n=3 Tax=Trichinella nativa TaxID=6335 RepID=A0A0V1KTV2_9BILA|nr:Ataxin-3 [Trichinella nativa]